MDTLCVSFLHLLTPGYGVWLKRAQEGMKLLSDVEDSFYGQGYLEMVEVTLNTPDKPHQVLRVREITLGAQNNPLHCQQLTPLYTVF